MTDCPLTRGQHEVLLLTCEGLTHGEIALRLGVPVSTVRGRASAAYERLGVSNGMQAVVKMIREGWDVEDVDVPAPSPGLRERLGLDRPGRWWRSERTGDDPLTRLILDIAQARPDDPQYRVPERPTPPPVNRLRARLDRERQARDLAAGVPSVELDAA